MGTPNLDTSTTVTIANNASLSGASAIFDGSSRLMAIVMDGAWDTNSVTFQASLDAASWFNVYDATGSEYTLTAVAASTWRAIDPTVFLGARAIKVRSGTAGAAVNQTGATVVTLVLKPI